MYNITLNIYVCIYVNITIKVKQEWHFLEKQASDKRTITDIRWKGSEY